MTPVGLAVLITLTAIGLAVKLTAFWIVMGTCLGVIVGGFWVARPH